MNHFEFPAKFRALYDQAVACYGAGQRGAETFFSPEDKAWIEREDRLRRIILGPSLTLVWLLGLLLAFNGGYWREGWFLAKFALVVGLSAYHGWMVGYAKQLARGERSLSETTLRLLNEVPGVAAALIVILAIVRP